MNFIKNKFFIFLFFVFFAGVIFAQSNIDNTDKNAWGESMGWVNLKPNNNDGVEVKTTKLIGYAWNEDYGWINLNPDQAGVDNDGRGNLSGSAWGENLGWINFNNVKINPNTGYFSGYAETEHNGKIQFNGDNFKVKTLWGILDTDNCKEHSMHGNAWSDGIGWISFDCKSANSKIDYGVDVDRDGNLSGYAWSDSVGWINFDYYGGDQRARYNKNTKKLEGMVKILSGLDDDDGWTGTISLQGQTDGGDQYAPIYTVSTWEFDDFAWGDEPTGWIDFKTDYSVVTMDPFYFRFYANRGGEDDPVPAGENVVLTWETAGAVSCTGSEGSGTSWVDNTTKPVGEPNNATETVSNLSSDVSFKLTCKDGGGNSLVKEVKVKVAPPPPEIFVTVEDDNIPHNTATTLHWTVKNTANCRLTSSTGRDEAVDSSDGEHTISTGNLTESTNWFTVRCDAANQDYYPGKYVEDTVYVDVEKLKLEFYPESNPIRYKGKIKLFWRTEFANSCTASGDLTEFNGNKDTGENLKEWERSSKEETEGAQYKVKMYCTGREGQEEEKELYLRVGNNPVFGEI